MLSVFLIHMASLMSLPALSHSRSTTLAFSQSITWFSLQTWSLGIFTRAEKTRAASICNKSAITDHVCYEHHVNAKVVDRESDKDDKLIREAIWIRKTDNMHWDDGSYQLSMGQAFTYWRPASEVSPDEGFRCEAETSINSMLFWLYYSTFI